MSDAADASMAQHTPARLWWVLMLLLLSLNVSHHIAAPQHYPEAEHQQSLLAPDFCHDEPNVADQMLRLGRLSNLGLQRSGAHRDPHHVMALSAGRRGPGLFLSRLQTNVEQYFGLPTCPKVVTESKPDPFPLGDSWRAEATRPGPVVPGSAARQQPGAQEPEPLACQCT